MGSLANPSVSRDHAYPHLSVKDLESFWLYVFRLQGSLRHHRVLTLSLLLIGFLRALANSCYMSWALGWRYPVYLWNSFVRQQGLLFLRGSNSLYIILFSLSISGRGLVKSRLYELCESPLISWLLTLLVSCPCNESGLLGQFTLISSRAMEKRLEVKDSLQSLVESLFPYSPS